MSIISMITDFIGTPTSYPGEIVIYTLAAYILLVVIESMLGIFYAILKVFK
jgi:hypothetical protein